MQPGAIFYVHLTNYNSDKQVEEKECDMLTLVASLLCFRGSVALKLITKEAKYCTMPLHVDTYSTVQKFGVSKVKNDTFIQQGHLNLIKSDSKDIHML